MSEEAISDVGEDFEEDSFEDDNFYENENNFVNSMFFIFLTKGE